jgi:hypothetical protein
VPVAALVVVGSTSTRRRADEKQIRVTSSGQVSALVGDGRGIPSNGEMVAPGSVPNQHCSPDAKRPARKVSRSAGASAPQAPHEASDPKRLSYSLPMSLRVATAAYVAFLVVLAASSPTRLVGDGGEYLQMAQFFARGDWPRPGITHFWCYSLLASPFVFAAERIGLDPLVGFTALNVALLGAAFRIAMPALGWQYSVLLFAGPVIWWVDKAHTEAFTFSLISVAVIWLTEAPGWSMIAVALAATQNPPFAAVAGLFWLSAVGGQPALRRDRWFWTSTVIAAAVALLHPLYYEIRLGRPGPIMPSALRIPNRDELLAVLLDTNIGLSWNFPILALSVGAALLSLSLARRRQARLAELLVVFVAGVWLLFGVAQATNYNHGGTRNMSRYAIWFMPLAIPLFRSIRESGSPGLRRLVSGATCVSVALTLILFRPSLPETYLRPTAVARYLWTHHPGFSNPLPEIFVERLRHDDGDWWVPQPTAGCEKILLAPRRTLSAWPLPCPPVPLPAECTGPGVMCYANRTGDARGYDFVPLPPPTFSRYKYQRQRVWSLAGERSMGAVLHGLEWWRLSIRPYETRALRAADRVADAHALEGEGVVFIYVLAAEAGASVTLRLPGPMTGEFLDGETGAYLEPVSYEGEPNALWRVPVPGPRDSVALTLRGHVGD